MPQENWLWKSNDNLVKDYLSGGEIASVQRWQTSDEYVFEFHPGHTTGDPIYIRPVGNTDRSNLPKFDTKNCAPHMYSRIEDFSNGGKLKRDLSQTAITEILAIVSEQWEGLQELARNYWQGEPVNRERKTALELWAEEEGAETGQHETEISRSQLMKILGRY